MATRAQIDRIARQVDRLASSVNAESVAYVPIYDGESEAEALKAYGQPHLGGVTFNRARPGDRREVCQRSGMDTFYRLGPADVRHLLALMAGRTRGIPTNLSIESFEGSEH
jgi:hypothetical protein